MATIRERLDQFAKSLGMKGLASLESACGFTKNTLTKDREGISSTTLVRIVDFYPQLCLDWVILGRGSMLVEESPHFDVPSSFQNDIHDNATVNINYGALKDVIVEAIKEAKL